MEASGIHTTSQKTGGLPTRRASLMSPIDITQQSHRHLRFSPSELHDQPANLHDGNEITTLPVDQARLDAEDVTCPGPPTSPLIHPFTPTPQVGNV